MWLTTTQLGVLSHFRLKYSRHSQVLESFQVKILQALTSTLVISGSSTPGTHTPGTREYCHFWLKCSRNSRVLKSFQAEVLQALVSTQSCQADVLQRLASTQPPQVEVLQGLESSHFSSKYSRDSRVLKSFQLEVLEGLARTLKSFQLEVLQGLE